MHASLQNLRYELIVLLLRVPRRTAATLLLCPCVGVEGVPKVMSAVPLLGNQNEPVAEKECVCSPRNIFCRLRVPRKEKKYMKTKNWPTLFTTGVRFRSPGEHLSPFPGSFFIYLFFIHVCRALEEAVASDSWTFKPE